MFRIHVDIVFECCSHRGFLSALSCVCCKAETLKHLWLMQVSILVANCSCSQQRVAVFAGDQSDQRKWFLSACRWGIMRWIMKTFVPAAVGKFTGCESERAAVIPH